MNRERVARPGHCRFKVGPAVAAGSPMFRRARCSASSNAQLPTHARSLSLPFLLFRPSVLHFLLLLPPQTNEHRPTDPCPPGDHRLQPRQLLAVVALSPSTVNVNAPPSPPPSVHHFHPDGGHPPDSWRRRRRVRRNASRGAQTRPLWQACPYLLWLDSLAVYV